jgi:hypothetical protein
VKATKSVRLKYEASAELSSLFEDFRLMCNDALRIALTEKPRSRFRLIELSYRRLKEYGLHSHYILSACEVAFAAYRNKKRKCAPHIRRVFLKLDSQSYSLNHLILRVPMRPRNFVYLTLQASDHHLLIVDDPAAETFSYVHAGAPATYTLQLSSYDANGNPITFTAPAASANKGDTLTFRPDWTQLAAGAGTVSVLGADGSVVNRTLS